ncbi:MAG TPA: hypothetical protein DCW48_02750 [Methylotenera mobilis]|uniref:Uncharacterized protein n=1 Tax=Methylotenera mobilis TaxID=359408 RepID=A0A351R982_9PROT|nr:hypothetical protein [Methylotenera mobilis]
MANGAIYATMSVSNRLIKLIFLSDLVNHLI